MAYDLYTGDPGDETAKVAYYMRLFGNVRSRRVNFEAQWEEAAALCWPEYRNSFSYGHMRSPGAKYTEFQVDTAGSIASHRFMGICDALLTPFNMLWSVVQPSDPALLKDRAAKIWFDDVTRILWTQRYRPEANFTGQNQQNFQCLGVFGNMGMFVDELDIRPLGVPRGIRYMATSPGEIYVLQNHQGRVDGFIRHFRWTARQAYQRWGDKVASAIRAALEQNSQELFDFLQFVTPRTDYNPELILTPRGKPYSSCYVSVVGFTIMEESGYRTFPLPFGRYMQAPEEDYGRGPAQMVLPELKTLNAEKADFLKQGHLAADPAYLLPNDGGFDFKSHAGAFNYGGMSEDGKRLIDILPTGNIQVSQEMMADSKKSVDDAFLVALFPLLFDDKGRQRSAREVVEIANDRAMFLSPLGRQLTEYVGPLIDRELDILSYLNLLPKMPPAMKEARGEYRIVYTSPLGRAFKGHAIAGYMRSVQMAGEVANITGDQSVFDIFEFDEAFPEIAQEQFSPTRWLASPASIQAKRKARAAAAERERQTKELPGQAAIMKAQAINSKAQAGMNIGGVLSGTPQGGMPVVPAAPRGTPGMPGVNGAPGTPGRPAP